MREIGVHFVDYWKHFDPSDNYFYHLLGSHFKVKIEEEDPDILFCSVFGSEKIRYRNRRCKRILFCGESRHNVDRSLYDLSLTCERESKNNIYFPLWVTFINWFQVKYVRERDVSYLLSLDRLVSPSESREELLAKKTVASSFIVHNASSKRRIDFCKRAQNMIAVECPGTVLHNATPIGGRGDQIEKIQYLEKCWLNIAFENTQRAGYVTEKLLHALYCGCVPVYWGGRDALNYFNKDRFLYHNGLFADARIIKEMRRLLNDVDEMIDKISRPALTDYALETMEPNAILKKLRSFGLEV